MRRKRIPWIRKLSFVLIISGFCFIFHVLQGYEKGKEEYEVLNKEYTMPVTEAEDDDHRIDEYMESRSGELPETDIGAEDYAACSMGPAQQIVAEDPEDVPGRLSVDFDDFNYDIALTAALFHDVGYANGQKEHHISSAEIFEKYAIDNDFDPLFIAEVKYIILNHSNKQMIFNNKNNEFVVLLEADLLDEEGSLGIVWDLLAAGVKHPNSYLDAIDEIKKHSSHILSQDYMVTPCAIKHWDEKKNLVKDFISQLYEDLFMEEE